MLRIADAGKKYMQVSVNVFAHHQQHMIRQLFARQLVHDWSIRLIHVDRFVGGGRIVGAELHILKFGR